MLAYLAIHPNTKGYFEKMAKRKANVRRFDLTSSPPDLGKKPLGQFPVEMPVRKSYSEPELAKKQNDVFVSYQLDSEDPNDVLFGLRAKNLIIQLRSWGKTVAESQSEDQFRLDTCSLRFLDSVAI